MGNLLNLKAAFAAMSFLLMAGGAAAQSGSSNGQLSGAGGAKAKYSADEIAAIMSEFDVTTTREPYDGSQTASLYAETPTGARFIITLIDCEDFVAATGCTAASVYTGSTNSGFAYEDVNQFNMDSDVTRAVNVSEQRLIIYESRMIFIGGVTADHIKALTFFFFMDMERHFEKRSSEGTQVSAKATGSKRGKIDNIAGDNAESDIDATPAAFMVDRALTAAIANKWDVRFLTEAQKNAGP